MKGIEGMHTVVVDESDFIVAHQPANIHLVIPISGI